LSDIAIKVENLTKEFQIGQERSGDFRESFSNTLKTMLGGKGNKETFTALDDISFEVKKGEALGIIGRNGAGKSTLLKILSRITEPTKGRIEINGRVSSLLEVGTGFHPELTGRENIYLNGTILGMTRREVKDKFDEIIDFSGIEKFIDTPVKHYSSGMKVRLAFSVAAHLEPEILLIDEVLAVGDTAFQKKCLGKMEDVAILGRTVLFVSHDMSAIQKLCNTGVVLRDKKANRFENINNAISNYSDDVIKTLEGTDSFKINQYVFIDFVKLNSKNFLGDDPIHLTFNIRSLQPNLISDLSVLFFNKLNQRVAIADLRDFEILKKSEDSQNIFLNIEFERINFIGGYYTLGIYLSSQLYTGNFYNVIDFLIEDSFVNDHLYEAEHRGFVQLNFDCKVE
jgi:ABC-type polysaccharide/polyol phosphate transport system ATPase subunit